MLFRMAIVLVMLVLPGTSKAQLQFNFIQHRPFDPIKLQTGLPEPASRLTSNSELQLSFAYANVFMGGKAANERLVLDGESGQTNLRYRHAVNACIQVNALGSWITNSGGRFDQPLDDWHQFFGLPDAMRDEWPNNQLQYRYVVDGTEQILEAGNQGLADAQVQVQHSLGCESGASILRAGVTVPVGSKELFVANRAVDMFVDYQSRWLSTRPGSRWHWAASVGLLKMGAGHFPKQRSLAGFGAVATNVTLNPQFALLGQLDWHTPLFSSELNELGATALQVSLGLRYSSRNNQNWEFSFTEDAVIDTGPDIVVRLAYRARFGQARR